VRRKGRGLIVGAALSVALAAIIGGTPQGRALVRPTWGFERLEANHRVRFETAAHADATRVATVLDRTIARVESAHGTRFAEPPVVFVCGTQDSFNAFLAQPGGRATGTVVLGRLLLSPRSFREGTYEAVLGHELSHLLLRRRRGWVSAVTEIPGWFHEGLAVFASGGGGALPVSEEAARRAIVAGRTFLPEDEGAFRPRMAADHGVSHHQFYRQSGLFVEFLVARDPQGFRLFLDALHRGEEFRAAFEAHLGETVREAWTAFGEDVRAGAASPRTIR
jgi:hypothetical protein